ncbi:MAG: hypothetical protein HOI95_16390 [Chromatiales bacterium]|nr:hypothetical protein [Chromatiales bacterium]
MTDTNSIERDERGDWRPTDPIALAPINHWPPNPRAIVQWLFRWPGYLWPYHAIKFIWRHSFLRLLTADLKE